MPRPKCPYDRKPQSRQAMVNYICGIGGYSDRHERWPIEFNVAADRCDLDFDNLYKVAKESGELPEGDENLVKLCFQEAHTENNHRLWEWGQEDAVESLHNADTYHTLWDGTDLKIEFELRGRCGKHLVLTEFEGYTLAGLRDDDLQELLMRQCDERGAAEDVHDQPRLLKGRYWVVDSRTVLNLYRYCKQASVEFTPAKASKEVEYQAMSHLCRIVEVHLAEKQAELADKEALTEHAKTVGALMDDDESIAAWKTLCIAADIPPPNL